MTRRFGWLTSVLPVTPLATLLNQSQVSVHPFVAGDLACGNLQNRTEILRNLQALPSAVAATHEEVLQLVQDYKLWSFGVGWIDAHPLASALVSAITAWTLDAKLARAANLVGTSFYPHP